KATSKARAKTDSAPTCETSAPFQNGRWPEWRRRSLAMHQGNEDVLQRALLGVEVFEIDVEFVQPAQQAGDAGFGSLRVKRIDKLMAIAGEFEMIAVQAIGHFVERRLQFERQLLLAELLHQGLLFLDENELAFVDDADAVGHFLGLF